MCFSPYTLLHSVVVIGFEQMAYVVFEGQNTEVCVSILDRELTNDEEREFTVFTSELSDNFATGMMRCTHDAYSA